MISFCIPTYNRAGFLARLLEDLVQQMQSFPYSYEVVISDNASTDGTFAVVESFKDKLPIRHVIHEKNIGRIRNVPFALSLAKEKYVIYLADDDFLIAPEVANTISRMEENPEIVAVYAPWKMYDVKRKKELGEFYKIPHDMMAHNHRDLIVALLDFHIFPEIFIARREAVQAMPDIHPTAYYAFVNAAEYVKHGSILFQKTPFYRSQVHDDQAGNEESMYSWDSYRGGLEYILSFLNDPRPFLEAVQEFVAIRMAIAIKLQKEKRTDPLGTAFLERRVKGTGYGQFLQTL